MALSPNYGWSEPDNSSLVKNGAADIRTLGDAIDTSLWNVGFGQAGKNKIINGDFGIWQRGTSFTTSSAYTADRYYFLNGGSTTTISQQTFTPGTAPVAGYESQYFLRATKTSTGDVYLEQRIENVRTLAGQTVTFSFWAKAASAGTPIVVYLGQVFGSGGSTRVDTTLGTPALTTSWQRVSYTTTLGSMSGKTIGSGSFLSAYIGIPGASSQTIDTWGWQVEAGSIATPFQTASGGSPQAELAMCQRYFYQVPNGNTKVIGTAFAISVTEADIVLPFPVQMRTTPTYSNTSGTNYFRYLRNGGTDDFDGLTLAGESTNACAWLYNNSQITGIAGQAGLFQFNNASATMSFSAEL